MDRKNYQGKRWVIVYGDYSGVEGFAVDEAYKMVQQYVPYILTVKPATAAAEELKGCNVLLIGTQESNPHIAKLAQEGWLTMNPHQQGYTVKLDASPFDAEMQALAISGTQACGALYGLRDLEHLCLESQKFKFDYYYDKYFKLFQDDMPVWQYSSAPAIEQRGLWTWGHVIYDYRGYIDNMAKWKMNTITIWNDYLPLNAKEVAAYARSRGIGVVWGFSWCWGEKVDPASAEALAYWTKRVIETYETQYVGIDGDGIYFQTFTEHEGEKINGKSTADLAVDWVNAIAGKLLDKYPALRIQFGLHANGVAKDIDAFAAIDPRLAIVWEDGGSFPFHYDPNKVEEFPDTLARLTKMASLRGAKEDFGMVVKGGSILPWPEFEHQKGPFVLGQGSRRQMGRHAEEEKQLYRYNQAYWMKNLDLVLQAMAAVAASPAFNRNVTGLFEDCLWEVHPWAPAALLAESLWNPHREAGEIIRLVSMSGDAYFV
jgi:hypothetical protein